MNIEIDSQSQVQAR